MQFKTKIILLISGILALVIGVIIYLISCVPPVQPPPLEPTAGWKTYSNEEFGFEVKYPSNFSFQVRKGGGFTETVRTLQTVTFNDIEKYGDPIIISIMTNPLQLSAWDWIKYAFPYLTQKTTDLEEFSTSNNIKGIRNSYFETNQGEYYTTVYFAISTKVYEIVYRPVEPNNYYEIYKQMVNTFRFTLNIYQQAQEQVGFPVMYPTYLPEGSSVVDFNFGKGVEPEDLGGLIAKYASNKGDFRIFEGTGDMGRPEGAHQVRLENGSWVTVSYYPTYNDLVTRCIYFGGEENYSYIILSSDLSEEEMLKIVNSMKSLK